jgi:hypothetical protein
VSGFKELILRNSNSIEYSDIFIEEVEKENSANKDYGQILTKMKARDEEYKDILRKAESGELDLNSYIRFLSLL